MQLPKIGAIKRYYEEFEMKDPDIQKISEELEISVDELHPCT